jgi:hypothetical protein
MNTLLFTPRDRIPGEDRDGQNAGNLTPNQFPEYKLFGEGGFQLHLLLK